MSGWKHVTNYDWTDEHGEVVARHIKWLLADGSKAMPWRMYRPGTKRWANPRELLDAGVAERPLPYELYLFGLPQMLAAGRHAHVLLVEGEADVLALRDHGAVAVTHGAAGRFTHHQAEWFKGHLGPITICRDYDEPGAACAALRYQLLREVAGIPATHLRIARGRVRRRGADVRDHLDAGWGVDGLVSESLAKVRKLAAQATPESFTRAGYDASGINPETGFVFRMTTDELASLRDWKPVTT